MLRVITYKFVTYQISSSCFHVHTTLLYLLEYKKYTMERIILNSIDFLQESTIIEVLSLYSKVHFQTSKYFSMTQNSRSKFNFPIFQRIKDE